jgi:hypothetical protein
MGVYVPMVGLLGELLLCQPYCANRSASSPKNWQVIGIGPGKLSNGVFTGSLERKNSSKLFKCVMNIL